MIKQTNIVNRKQYIDSENTHFETDNNQLRPKTTKWIRNNKFKLTAKRWNRKQRFGSWGGGGARLESNIVARSSLQIWNHCLMNFSRNEANIQLMLTWISDKLWQMEYVRQLFLVILSCWGNYQKQRMLRNLHNSNSANIIKFSFYNQLILIVISVKIVW